MRIEVLIGNDNPRVFPINSSKLTLGSSVNSDIIIKAEGISRKHLNLVFEDGVAYVIDQGSTNGTYLNEERLVPGRKVEFTTFFPIRLGHNVLISLLDDDELSALDEGQKEKTSPIIKLDQTSITRTAVLPASELNKVKTEKLVQKRNEKRAKDTKPKAKPKKKEGSSLVPFFALAIFAGAFFYNVYLKPQAVPEEEFGNLPLKKVPVQAVKPVDPVPVESPSVPDQNLVPKENFVRYLSDIKCTSDVEIYLCDFFPGAREEGFGVVQQGLALNILVNGASYIQEAMKYAKAPPDDAPESAVEYKNLVMDTAAYVYLLSITSKLDLSKLVDMRLSIVLFMRSEQGLEVARVIAIKPEIFNEKDAFVSKGNLPFIKSNGASALLITKDKYKTY